MITMEQVYEGHPQRQGAAGNFKGAQITYVVSGAASEAEALEYVRTHADRSYKSIPLSDVDLDEKIDDTFKVVAEYAPDDGSLTYASSDDPEPVLKFNIGGGTVRMTEAINLVESSEGAPDVGKMINFDGEKANGVDVFRPNLDFTLARYVDKDDIGAALLKKLKRCAGKMNKYSWRSYESGEVLFKGVEGGGANNTTGEVELVYHFSVMENETNVDVGGGITFAKVHGWDYAWNLKGKDIVDGKKQPKILGAYVHRVYHTADFKILGL